MRLLLVRITNAETIYEGFASWPQLIRWMDQIVDFGIPAQELANARKLLKRKRLATIKEVQVSLPDIESPGLSRANNSA
jgi:hypothetical protein